MGGSSLSRSGVSKGNLVLKESFEHWHMRDLSAVDISYLFVDGFSTEVRSSSAEKKSRPLGHQLTAYGMRLTVCLSLAVCEST